MEQDEEAGDQSKSVPFPAPPPPSPPPAGAPDIPVEIVSEDEMAAIEIALSAAASRFSYSSSSKLFLSSSASSSSPPQTAVGRFRSRRSLSGCSSGGPSSDDIEDSGRSGYVEGIWITGVIDEVQMPLADDNRNPSLIDTKTRSRATLPTEAQKRNARFQLMCYKYLWDSVIADFPLVPFFDHFGLDPQSTLSDDVKHYLCSAGIQAQTLGELMTCFRNICCLLPPAHDQLLLRYEFQGDHSLLGEYHFLYDPSWVESQIQWYLKFWTGQREADFVSEEENWKCRFCSFTSICPRGSKVQE